MKKTGLIKEIRAILRGYPEGLSTTALAAMTSRSNNNVRNTLVRMPDVYIDRWQTTSQGKTYCAVWCIVVPPENCPHPSKESTRKSRKIRDSREDEREADENV